MRNAALTVLMAVSLVFSAAAQAESAGDKLYAEMLASVGAYEDPELTAYLEGLVREIVAVSEMAGEEVTFTLLDGLVSDLSHL